MGIIKDAIREVLTQSAKEQGRDIRFLDSPTMVIETTEQAKKHDMELVEKPRPRKYAPIVYKHNGFADRERSLLFLYVYDNEEQKTVGYISFSDYNIYVCRGCEFGRYNLWREGCHLYANPRNAKGLTDATESFEKIFAADRYQFIITAAGKAEAKKIMKGGNNE